MRARGPATGHNARLARGLFLEITMQLLWLLCCLWSYTVVVRTFGYEGFAIVAPVSATKLMVVVLALIGLSLLLPHRLDGPADYVVVALFDISFVPFCTYWALSNQPWWQALLMTTYWGLVLLVARFPLRSAVHYVKGAQNVMFLVAGGLVVLGGILIVAGGHLTLQLPLGDVYAVRTVWVSEGSGMSMYLFPWLANALLPLLLGHAWKNRRLGELFVLGFTAYMLFTSTGMKAYLFMPVLVALVLLIAAWRPLSSFMPMGLGVFASTMILLDRVTKTVSWSSLGLRRSLFIPAQLTSVYLEFFAANPVVRMSDSILLRGWLTYPYSVSVAHLIGAVLGQPSMGANNGLISDGFANFGIVGSLVWAVLLGILIRLLRAATERRENRPEAWAVAAMWPVVLLSSALTTSLLTHGLALGLLAVWTLQPERPSGESRNSEQRVASMETANQSHRWEERRGSLALAQGAESLATCSLVGTKSLAWDSLFTEGQFGNGETSLRLGALMSRCKQADAPARNGAGLDAGQDAGTRFMTAISGKRTTLVSIGRGPGDPRAMEKEARSLAHWGYEVTYICNAASGPMVTDDHVHVDALKMPTSRLARQMNGPSMVLREALRSRPDIVHVFDPALIGPALRFGRRYGVKIVVDLAEDNAKQILQKSYLGPMVVRKVCSHIYRRMSQSWLLQADLVIVATRSIAGSLPAGCQHIIVRNFPTIAEIDAVPSLASAASKSCTPVLRVVYVGGISSIRGIRELILATGMLHGAVELHLAGPVYDDRFLDEMESLTAWQYCHYHGWLDWQGSIALVKTCDVGACVLQAAPNHMESLPVKVFEYMACGRGSIISSFPLWRSLFVGAAVFVDPTSPTSIAQLMEQLLAKPALLRRLSERGRSLAEQSYSWESESQRLADGYADL